ncbi:uncharacterized protein LOC116126961 [Pistacia vera]|uniref:uncharacterized protein LOC116126961 n=1 Tax=Pistacia vera TaxID=55513 RepID=UPI001262D029|nr:uncharacterized protein LOC116126961 [Pistacia vera]
MVFEECDKEYHEISSEMKSLDCKALIKFNPKYDDHFEVKKCGIHLLYDENYREPLKTSRRSFDNAKKKRKEKEKDELQSNKLQISNSFDGINSLRRCFTSICPPRHRKLSTHHPLKGNAPLPKSIALDTTCYLTVDSPANIVAKGTIMEYEGSNVWVTMDVVFDGSPYLPFPNEENFLVKVSDGVGHRLLWPKELIIRATDMVSKKVVKKKYATPKKVPKKSESVYDKVDFDMEIEDIDPLGNELAITPVKSKPQQMKVDKKRTNLGKRKAKVMPLKMKKIRQSVVLERDIVQHNPFLKIFSIVVNRLIPNKQTIRVQTDDNLFQISCV